jgi:hypothetical protein
MKDYTVGVDNERKKVIEITTRDLYWHFVGQTVERPTSEQKWEEQVGLGYRKDDWEYAYSLPYTLTKILKFFNSNLK